MKVIKFKKVILLMLVLTILFLAGCVQEIKDDKVYLLNTSEDKKCVGNIYLPVKSKGIVNFEGQNYKYESEDENNIIASISPDKKNAILIKRIQNVKAKNIIKGYINEFVDVYMIKISTNKMFLIASKVPFISDIKWNKDGSIAALWGGGKLIIYDAAKEKRILKENLENQEIIYCGWSPDGKKLYTEHDSLSNDSIYYTDSDKMLSSYETKESLFYKGVLDNKYYYATKLVETFAGITSKTVITDSDGNIYEDFLQGRYRDSYRTSMLQIGEREDGLYYFEDINEPQKYKIISQESICDAKFIYGGNFVYITKNNDIEKNNFKLNIIDNMGNKISDFDVSGNSILISPDGRHGYIGGYLKEKIDLVNCKIEYSAKPSTDDENDKEAIFSVIRAGMGSYYCKVNASESSDITEKYFINTYNPDEWALLDVSNIKKNIKDVSIEKSAGDLLLKKITIYFSNGQKRAQANIEEVNAYESETNVITDMCIELIKKDNKKWYITGLSTFPESDEAKEVKKETEGYIHDLEKGVLFGGKLANEHIEVGQIQFWEKDLPQLASDIKKADSCKIYLKAKGKSSIKYYKFILEKQESKYWKPASLQENELYGLN